MLVCSSLLASIGLDLGSTAVVIGAMLISPLMSPILGVGLSVGIADRTLLSKASRELGLATLVALGTSTLYFFVSPLAEPTAELIARTTPTLLDVGVAFFGGVAGIVAGSRREQSLALPGVAIATALMPPLCTAGFGLATWRPEFLFGALYLFALNALFIALATFSIVRLLKFPLVKFETGSARRRAFRLIGGGAAVAVLPSLWFLYTTVQERREEQRIDAFVRNEVTARNHDVLRWTREMNGDTTVVKIFVAGRPVSAAELDTISRATDALQLGAVQIRPVQSELTRDDLSRMETTLRTNVLEVLALAQAARDSTARAASGTERRGNPALDSVLVRQLAREVREAFPEVQGIAWSPITNLLAPDSVMTLPTLMLDFAPQTTTVTRRDIQQRVQALARIRLKTDSVLVRGG